MGTGSTDRCRGDRNRRRLEPRRRRRSRSPAARSFATRSFAPARFSPRREFLCMESSVPGCCCMCLRGRAGWERGRRLRSMLLSRVGSGSVLQARHAWDALARSLPRVPGRPSGFGVWRWGPGQQVGRRGVRAAGERNRGSGRRSPSPGSQSPLSEWGLSVLHPLRSSLGATGELSESRWEPVESGQNFGPAQDTCLGKFG